MIPTHPITDGDARATAHFWRSRAAGLARRLNFHHWLTRFVPRFFGLLVLAALLDLLLRELGAPARWTVALLLFGLAVVSGWAWLLARGRFCTGRRALVRLETVLGLNSRLSAAQDGAVPWPQPQAAIDDGYDPNWKRILLPLLAGGLFLACAHLVPVSKGTLAAGEGAISEPPEIAQVQSWINALKADDLVRPDKLQEMQEALDKLREKPAQDWYKQGDLEAANSLKELSEQSMNSLAHDLDSADQAVQGMQDKVGSGDAGALKPMQDQLRSAEQNLAAGTLPLKQELVDKLKGAENATDKALTPGQLAALHERLKKGELAARTAPKSGGSSLSEEMQKAMAEAEMGGGMERRDAEAAPGGLGGGKKSAPLELEQRANTTPDGKLTPVHNDDMSRASLGQTIKISAGEHTVNPADYTGVQPAGSAQVAGTGGEAVWRSTYDPQEADTLTRFFK